MDALYSFPRTPGFEHIDYIPIINQYLDSFKRDPKSNPYGYKLLQNETIPFDKQVGDGIGLFPINYLTRAIDYVPSNETDTDWRIVQKVAYDFVLGFPHRLADGTFSRHNGWPGEVDKNASFLWGDDQFMGLTLLSRLGALQLGPNATMLVEFVAKQAIQFAEHMMDKTDGLFFHGYNDADKKTSCCKWGRANGWGTMSHVEVRRNLVILKALL